MKFFTSTKSNKNGFTLIELLVSIAIIGVLAAIVISSLSNSRAKARDGKRISDTKQMQLALEGYFDNCAQYPPFSSLSVLVSGGTCPNGTTPVGSFLPAMPKDPITAANYAYVPTPSGCSSSCSAFTLSAQLEQYSPELANDASSTNNAQFIYDVKGP